MPEASDYRPLPGRNRGNIRPDGTSTRVKIDLFPEYTRHLTHEKRAIWDLVGRALCSSEVQAAFMRSLAPGLKRRFGSDFAKVGMYPIPVLTRDIPGYRITPHTDTQWKGITVQLYLPRDAVRDPYRHHLPRAAAGRLVAQGMQMRFAPNTGYAFAVGDNTWHSADPVGTEVKRGTASCSLISSMPGCCESCAIAANGSAIFSSARPSTWRAARPASQGNGVLELLGSAPIGEHRMGGAGVLEYGDFNHAHLRASGNVGGIVAADKQNPFPPGQLLTQSDKHPCGHPRILSSCAATQIGPYK